MSNPTLFPDMAPHGDDKEVQAVAPVEASAAEPPRLRVPDRAQALLMPIEIEALLPPEHPARTIWALVCRWDLSKFLNDIRARGSDPGRAATDPRLLLALWLYASTENVAKGRELERLCSQHDAYRWLCGGVSVNYHSLNDFRTALPEALDDVLTQMLAVLTKAKVVRLERIIQDGTRVRAGAGARSFKRRKTLEDHLQKARAHVATLRELGDDAKLSAQQRAGRQRAAREKVERLEHALDELAKVEDAKAKQKNKPTKENPARASTTDPEARFMRMPDGGTRPGYNVQFSCDPHSRVVVGVDVTNNGSDSGQAGPMRQQVQERTGQTVREHVVDGGYAKLEEVDQAAAAEVKLFMPVPQPRKEGVDPHAPKPGDSPAVIEWRQRMATDEAKAIMPQRSSTIETVNAETKTQRGMHSVLVRGLAKVKCLALLAALAYNVVHCAEHLLQG